METLGSVPEVASVTAHGIVVLGIAVVAIGITAKIFSNLTGIGKTS